MPIDANQICMILCVIDKKYPPNHVPLYFVLCFQKTLANYSLIGRVGEING